MLQSTVNSNELCVFIRSRSTQAIVQLKMKNLYIFTLLDTYGFFSQHTFFIFNR